MDALSLFRQYPPEETACFTGHRQIPVSDEPRLRWKLRRTVASAYDRGYRLFLCGGALGFDTLAAREVLAFRINHPETRLVIVIPCAGQADRWSPEDRDAYREILRLADASVTLSEKYYAGCMQARNQYMVDRSSLCLCYMTQAMGGTWYTVRCALRRGVELENLAMLSDETTAAILKENPWKSIFISRSASGNVIIAPSRPSRLLPGNRYRLTSAPSCMKRKSVRRKSPNP